MRRKWAIPTNYCLMASNYSLKVVNGKYRSGIKYLAVLLRSATEIKTVTEESNDESDSALRILRSLAQNHSLNLKNNISDFILELKSRKDNFENTQSQPAYLQFTESLKEGIFLHILCKEIKNVRLFGTSDLLEFSKSLDYKENDLRAIFTAIQIWNEEKYSLIPHSMLFEFSGFSDPALSEAALFLSHELAMNSPDNKRELLIAHYMLVRKAINNFKDLSGQENIVDETLQSLFKVAIVMAYCGY